MSRARSSFIVLALSAGLSACIGGPPRPGGFGGPGGPPPGERPAGPQIFISPFGQVWRAEPGMPYPSGNWFAAADLDADSRVDLAEFTRDGLTFFDEIDADGDGIISFAENTAYETETLLPATRTRIGAPAGGPGGGRPPGRGGPGGGVGGRQGGSGRAPGAQLDGAAPFSLLNVPQPVRCSDLNTDQRVTRAEFEQAAGRWFRLLDGDGDGALTLETLPTTAAQAVSPPPGGGRGPS